MLIFTFLHYSTLKESVNSVYLWQSKFCDPIKRIEDLSAAWSWLGSFQEDGTVQKRKINRRIYARAALFHRWALGWMNNIRPENLALRVKTDVHAPSFLRVNGPVSNMPEFYQAFDVKPGKKMYRSDDVRVEIW